METSIHGKAFTQKTQPSLYQVNYQEKASKRKFMPTTLLLMTPDYQEILERNNLFSTAQGNMDGKWGFSIDNIEVEIANNHVTGGSLAGLIEIAALDHNSTTPYTATVSEDQITKKMNYAFSISPGNEITVNTFKSKLTLLPSTSFSVNNVADRFVPSAVLNGSWTVDFDQAKFQGINFQNLTVTTNSPYITSGIFALATSSSDNNCIGLPVSLNSVGMHLNPQNELSFSVGNRNQSWERNFRYFIKHIWC